LFVICGEAERDRVHAMTLIDWRFVTLPFKNMSEMASASRAGDLCAYSAKRTVLLTRYGTWEGIEEGWPAAATVKLGAALVKWRVAAGAGIDPCCLVMLVLPSPGSLGPFQPEHPELLWGENRLPFLVGLCLGVRHPSDGG